MESILTIAEQYISAGLQVHPCKGKIPTLKEWQKNRLDLQAFKRLYKPSDNIGIVTGKASGLICIDIDPRNGGDEWYEYSKVFEEFGNPVYEHTGSGGLHLYYKYPEGYDFIPSKTGFEKGVDILADGGRQVVTAPSIHECGNPYEITNGLTLLDALAEADPLPQWILEALLVAAPSLALNGHAVDAVSSIEASSASLELAIQALLRLEPAIQGQAGDCRTFQAAAVLRDYGLSQKEALQLMVDVYNPRCEPRWDLSQLKAKVRNAYQYAKGVIGAASPEGQFKDESTSSQPVVNQMVDSRLTSSPKRQSISIGLNDFNTLTLPEKEYIIGPIIKQGLAMVFAAPGVGKTHFCLNLAFAAATGGTFLRWKATGRSRVLYVDGELPANVLQERLRPLVSSLPIQTMPVHFNLITPDLQPDGLMMPDLATSEGQDMIEEAVSSSDLIIIDNISCLVRSGKENEAESWIPVQNWALKQRKAGKSIIFVHHTGKGEGASPRGTSKREDLLDCIIGLYHPVGYEADQGCVFEVKFRKARNFQSSDELKSFQAKYVHTEFSAPYWEHEGLDKRNSAKIERLFNEGVSQKEIAEQLGVSKQYVSKVIRTIPSDKSAKNWVD